MKILLGWPDGGQIEGPAFRGWEMCRVRTAEEFRYRLQDDFDAVAVHCALFADKYPWDWMTALRVAGRSRPTIVALCDKTYSSAYLDVVTELAASLDVELLPVGLPADRALALVECRLTGSEPGRASGKGRIVTVVSASPKDGATTVAAHTTAELARESGLRVGLLDLNLKSPDVRSAFDAPTGGPSLLTVRPSCMKGRLDAAQLLDHCVRSKAIPSLRLLLGTPRRDTSADFTLEQIEALLGAAREAFDLVVCDVHTFPDNAATVYAVKHADERWIVAQPSYGSFRTSWPDWYDSVWRHMGLKTADYRLVVNRAGGQGALKPAAVAAAMNVPLLASLPNVPGGAGVQASADGVLLAELDATGAFRSSVRMLAQELAERLGLAVAAVLPEKPRKMKRVMSALFS